MTKYHTQFEESTETIGTNLTTVTYRGTAAPSGYAPAYGTPAVKKRYCNFKCNASGVPFRNLVSLNAIDSDANRATVEVLGGFSYDAATVTDMTLALRGVGASATAATEGYMARCELTGNIYISRRSSATAITTVATTTFTFSSGKSYFVRFRANSTSLKLRVWDAALGMANEPTTWNIDTTDATYSTAGWVGFGGFGGSADLVAPWNFIAVATNGDTAVCPRTNTEYTAWLDSQSAIRCVLAEMSATGYDSGGSPYTKTINVYLSNHGYTSQQQDTPSLRHYDNYIQQIPTFTREMSTALSGQATTGFGDLIISNPVQTIASGGVRDDWLRMKWNRNYLKLYLGDPSWPKHDFRLMIYGRVGMPSAPSLGQIKFPIADLSDALNQPLVTSRFSTGDYVDQFKPKLLGWPRRFEPPRTAESPLTFTLDDGTIQDATLSVYDNGVQIYSGTLNVNAVNTGTGEITASANHGMVDGYRVVFFSGTPPLSLATSTNYWAVGVTPGTDKFKLSLTQGGAAITGGGSSTGSAFAGYGYTADGSAGTFTLVNEPAGRVFASCRDGLTSSTQSILAHLMYTVGGLSLNHKDAATFTALGGLETSESAEPGLWFDTTAHTIADAVNMAAQGMFAWWNCPPDGVIQIGRISLPLSTAVMSFTESDVVQNSLRLVGVIRAVDMTTASVAYAPSFLVGGALASSTIDAQTKLYLAPYSAAAAGTPLDDHPDQYDAEQGRRFEILNSQGGAISMRSHIANLFLHQLGIFEFTTRLSASQLNIGDTISLTHPRYGWKQYTASDDASPDNTGTVEARYAVVIGIATDVSKGTTKIKCFRRIPGYYPTADLN